MEGRHFYTDDVYDCYENFFLEEENILSYRPGGYHPVILGDTLKDGRYKICHKLGSGSFSTVWVAKDNKLEQWVSIKMIKADETNQSRELHNLRALTEYSKKENLESKHIIQLLDDFLHEGPNGCHQCFIFELLGPTIDILQYDYFLENERSHWSSIFDISIELLQALDFMHKAGYAHGDLSVKNLVFKINGLSHLSENELFKMLGHPISAELIRLDGKSLEQGVPSQIVESTKWKGWLDWLVINVEKDERVFDDDIRLIDLGESFYQNAVPKEINQVMNLRAPETIFADKFDYKVDLWSAGLLIYYLIFGSYPPLSSLKINWLIASMIDFIGELPLEWQSKWEQMKLDGKEDFEFKNTDQLFESDLKQDFDEQIYESKLERNFNEHVHEPQLKGLLLIIQKLTKFLPSDRISASQALNLLRNMRKENEDIEESEREGENIKI